MSTDEVSVGQWVLKDLDLRVLSDLGCPEDCRLCWEEVDHTGTPCFYIGAEEDLDAGLYGCEAEAPIFRTVESAYIWARRNEADLRNQFPYEVGED